MANEATPVVDAPLSLETMSETDRTKYLTTGALPDESTADAGEKPDESGAAPAAATTQEPEPPRETRADRRIKKLLAQNKDLEARLAALHTAPERRSEPKTETAIKAPRLKSFTDKVGTTYTDYDSAHEAWEDASDAFHAQDRSKAVAEALKAEQTKLEQAKQAETVEKSTEKNAKEFAKRSEEFRKTLKEDTFIKSFTEVKEAIDEVIQTRKEFSEFADFLVESEVGPQLIDYFGKNMDVFDELLDMPLTRAIRELGRLESSDKIKAPKPKTTTAAKRIGSNDVSGRSATSSDPVEEAVEKNDVMAYIHAMNAKEAAERRR